MGLPYSRFDNGNGLQNLTVFDPESSDVYVATSDHPNWNAILEGLENGGREVLDLFDVTKVIATKFEALSERVSVRNGRIFLDGDEVNNVLTQQILRFLDNGENFEPLVKFYDRLAQNPNQDSVEQLYRWLQSHDFTITDDGKIIGYKGVESDGNGGYQSVKSGTAIVNGEEISGKIPNAIGSVVEMPRSAVTFDPDVTCSYGLHVGTYDYAKGWGYGAILKVLVDPRDVVSVPSDCNGAKLRTCRYTVLDVITDKIESPVVTLQSSFAYDEDEDLEHEYCENCDLCLSCGDCNGDCEDEDFDACEVCGGDCN